MTDWNPELYLAFQRFRDRPVKDLIARLSGSSPAVVCDLGCGPGNSTLLLRKAFPDAVLQGFDSSPAMISKACATVPDATFAVMDVRHWQPPLDAGLVFSNAMFQWVQSHAAEMRRIFAALAAGAELAVQVPDNLMEPSHQLMREVADESPWRGRMAEAAAARAQVLEPAGYLEALGPLAKDIDVWRTSYSHVLPDHTAIVRMLSSTGLKPFLDALADEEERQVFLMRYVRLLEQHYPRLQSGGVVLQFPRLFIHAVRAT